VSGQIVVFCYVAALAFGLLLLWRCSHVHWYWHLLSGAAALVIGMMPPVPGWTGPVCDAALGCAFILLLVWGLGEPLFRWLHLPRHA
jgi:hypothetical protein